MALTKKTQKAIDLCFGHLFQLLEDEHVDRQDFLAEMRKSDHLHFGETHHSDFDTELAMELVNEVGMPDAWFIEYGNVREKFEEFDEFNKAVKEHGSEVHYENDERINSVERQDRILEKLAGLSKTNKRIATYFGNPHIFSKQGIDYQKMLNAPGWEEYNSTLQKKSPELGAQHVAIRLINDKKSRKESPLTAEAGTALIHLMIVTPQDEKAEAVAQVTERIQKGIEKLENHFSENKTDTKIVKTGKNEYAYLKTHDIGYTKKEVGKWADRMRKRHLE